jgi:hypothetical protein
MESSHQVWFMSESKQSEAADLAVPAAWRRWEWPLLGLLFVVSIAQVFRFALLSRFQLLFGDPIDGLIETSILEHWWNVARGLTGWKQTFYLYPSKGTLGYNDGYFLYGLVYSVYRAMGLDPFLSSELVNMSVRALGFAGFVAFARLVLRLPLWAAAVGAAIFTASDNSYFQGAHVQLLSVALAPVEALLLALFVSAITRDQGRRAAALGVGAALLLAAWFLSMLAIPDRGATVVGSARVGIAADGTDVSGRDGRCRRTRSERDSIVHGAATGRGEFRCRQSALGLAA